MQYFPLSALSTFKYDLTLYFQNLIRHGVEKCMHTFILASIWNFAFKKSAQ